MSAKPFSRRGLHRVTCDECHGFLYATISQLEVHGLPTCWCGQPMRPQRLELAVALGVDHPALDVVAAVEQEAARRRRGVRAAPQTL